MLILNSEFFKALLLSVRRKSDFNGKKIDKNKNYRNKKNIKLRKFFSMIK